MSRPWSRGPEGQEPEGGEAERKRAPWFNGPFIALEATDEEIRAYCLDQIRGQLGTPTGGLHSEAAMLRAAQFAAIAEAFHPGPE